MMATVPHVTSGLGLRKFQADGFLLTRLYIACIVTYCNIASLNKQREVQFLQYCIYRIVVVISNACCNYVTLRCVFSTTVYFVEVCRIQSVHYLLLLFRSDFQFIFLHFFGFNPLQSVIPFKALMCTKLIDF